ncbi:MAG: AAA family ATPase, partial [Polyangiales bacterium]
LSQLAHPRIIEVYEYGVDAAGAYYTMELLGGQDLRALEKIEWRKACELLRDVASSLALLHSRRLVHCDVSPRNVRCTIDGHAKLLDFGAMMPMGVAKRVVGTPPFIAPELLQLQPLDGRTDLYGLGALGYYLLTGRHAYPARTARQLRDVWRKRPLAPSDIDPEIPPALSQLVMELLQHNRNARPRSAGITMERLCAIASLPFEEQADVAESYLTTPTLVGRDTQLATVRRHLADTARSKGSVLVVAGAAGSGRSRFLDACVLDGKLLGCHVLRTDAGDAGSGSYGVARALSQRLFELAPDAAARAAHLHAPVLAHVIGDIVGAPPSATPPERRKLLSSLRDFLLSAARSLRLVIAVDDADRIDEASASLLVALAQKAHRRSLCVIVAMDSEGEGSAALDLLGDTSTRVELEPLLEAETEQLLRSVFGDTGHLLTVARHLHTTARGNPRAIMQLATHLVTQGIAHYEAGSFVLPERLNEGDLPRSLSAALERRAGALEPDALELGRVLALTGVNELPTASYIELTRHGDRARTYRAIDQLVRAQVLDVEGERYRLSDDTWRSALCGPLSSEERVALHARLARVFEQVGSVSRRAFHFMESDQPEVAIRVLLAQYLKDPNEPRDPLEDYVPGMLDLLERATQAAGTLHIPAPMYVELRMKTAGASQFMGDLARFLRIAPPLLAQLTRESGLSDYVELDTAMEPMARLTEALTRVQQRYDQAPEDQRGLSPIDAIRELARLCVMFAGVTATAQDPSLLEGLPPIEVLSVLSPAIAVIHQFNAAMYLLMQGRSLRARAGFLDVIARLDQPDRAGLGALYHKSMRLGALYILGLIDAGIGMPNAGERVRELDGEPGHRVNAQRVHMSSHLMQGDVEQAAAAQRRAELMMLQDGQQQRYPNSSARIEMYAYALADDVEGMKLVTERTAKLAKLFPRWKVLVHLGRCHHRRMQGDFAGALEALEPALTLAAPLRHREWPWLAASHIEVLTGLGRAEEAIELGRAHLELCEREGLEHGRRDVARATAEALIARGRIEEAIALLDGLIAEITASGARGLPLGIAYDVRARAAIAEQDAYGFRGFADLCATEYHADRNPVLAQKYERLLQSAKQHEIEPPPPSQRPSSRASRVAPQEVYLRLARCSDAAERARCVLSVLVDLMQPDQAFLYGLHEGQVSLLCALPPEPELDNITGAVARYVERELQFEPVTAVSDMSQGSPELATASMTEVDVSGSQTQGTMLASDVSGRGFHALLLTTKREGQPMIAAVAAMRFASERRVMPPQALLDTLAAALIENDDVDAVTCIG